MENDIQPVTNPEEAIDQFVSDQYLEWVMDYVLHEVRTWESLKQLSSLPTKPEKIKKFMLQRFIAAEAFLGSEGDPGFLGFAIANLSESSDPVAESALELMEAKKQDELSGSGASNSANIHRTLWLKLLKGLGISDEELKRVEPKEATRNYIAELSDVFSNSDWQTAMAAFAVHEKIMPEEYSAILALLKANTAVSDSDLEVLTWHTKAGAKYFLETKHILEKIAVDKEGKEFIFDGVRRQLEARKEFYDEMLKYLHHE